MNTVLIYIYINLGVFNIESRQIWDSDFLGKDAIYFIVEYRGDIAGAVNQIPNARVFVADEKRAILSIIGDVNEVFDKIYDVIDYINPNDIYILSDISPVEASGADIFHNNPYLSLDGTGVIVGIVDTGIDYLNEEFINPDNTSRIIAIFDQTISTENPPKGQPIGSEYTREDINRAIKTYREGKDPYAIVPSRDEIGHGTNMAGIIGARGLNPNLKGAAPGCNLAVVKVAFSSERLREQLGVYGNVPTFSTVTTFLGIKYLNDLAVKLKIPMVIFFAFGGNLGPHNGQSFLERYIDEISSVKGVTVVVPVGNQGDSDTHTSGTISKKGDIANIELKVDKDQRNLRLDIWIKKPDKSSLSIVSPTGEIIDRIIPKIGQITEVNFLYEGTKMYIQYFIPEEQTGDERIVVDARNIKEGIWVFKLIGDLVVTGRYDAYLIQRQLLAPGTKFLSPDPYTTLTLPSTSRAAISVASYNQNNNSNISESGRGYTRDGRIKPEIAAGGVNALTTAVGGGTRVVSGTSVAAAVVAGCCALIYQWGEVEGSDRPLYSTKVKTYLIRGASQIEGRIFPNPDWGYGIINMKGVFDNIRLLTSESKAEDGNSAIKVNEFYIGKLFIRLPD